MKHSAFVKSVYEKALAAGMSDAAARVTAGQAAIETGYGKHAPGNNLFGIKAGSSWTGPTETLMTTEGTNGQRVPQTFRVYATPDASLADRVAVMDHAFPGFSQAATVGDALNSLQNGRYGKYYTGSQSDYEHFINTVNDRYLGGTPVPPENISGGANDPLSAIDSALGRSGSANPHYDAEAFASGGANARPRSSLNSAFNAVTGPSDITPRYLGDGATGISGRQPMSQDAAAAAGATSWDSGRGSLRDPRTSDLLTPGPTLGDSRQVRTTRTVANPAYADWKAKYGAPNTSGSPDDRDAAHSAIMGGLGMTGGSIAPPAPPMTLSIPITYSPSAPSVSSPAPPASTGFSLGSLGDAFNGLKDAAGSSLGNLTNSAGSSLNYLGSQAQSVGSALPAVADNAKNAVITAAMMSPQARGAIIDPMIASIFTSHPGVSIADDPNKYGATFADRQLAAQNRDRLSQGLPPLPAGTGPSAPTIGTTYRHGNNDNSGQSSNGGGQSFQGTHTGRSYTVGNLYRNGNGTYRAMSDGSFERV